MRVLSLRVLSLFVVAFLFLSTVESWAGYWLAARWFISSRYASVPLGTVKLWLDRGIITTATRTAKVFIQRNGKWILLTLGLSSVLSELQNIMQSSKYCYIFKDNVTAQVYVAAYSNQVSFTFNYAPNTRFYTLSSSCSGTTRQGAAISVPVYEVYERGVLFSAMIPPQGTYTLVTPDGVKCTATVSWTMPLQQCGSSSQSDWQNERRKVPVQVFPNPADFVRDDVIARDPALSWLRDQYQNISADSSIPTIPDSDLVGVELPQVDWSIPPEEAIDHDSESSQTGEKGEGVVDVPGLDTSLRPVERKSFPVELIDSIVQNHPLLRIFSNVHIDTGSGTCLIGSHPFQFNFCDWGWVLNVMGGVIVFVAFLTGLVWTGRSE